MSIGLVLAGGGMRGAFTSGVLEVFLREGIDFKYVIGVSAGALTAMSYLSNKSAVIIIPSLSTQPTISMPV